MPKSSKTSVEIGTSNSLAYDSGIISSSYRDVLQGIVARQFSHKTNPMSLEVTRYDNVKKYYVEVNIIKTGNGSPGHASASFIEETSEKPQVIGHVSYMPKPITALFAGMTMGCMPVLSENISNLRPSDINGSVIYRRELTEKEFKAGVAKQQEIEIRTDKGLNTYAIRGNFSRLAVLLNALYGAYLGSENAIKNHKEKFGLYPDLDFNGFLLLPDSPSVERTTLLNCTQAVCKVLIASGLPIKEDFVLPGSLGAHIEDPCFQFNIVQDSLVPIALADIPVNEEEEAERNMHEL